MIDQRWIVLVVLFVARSSFGYQFQSLASQASPIEAELHIGYAAIGTLIGLYTLPAMVLSLPGGVLGARFGERAICVGGLLLMIAGGLLMGIGDGLASLAAGRLICGVGAVLFNLALTKMLTDWFVGREIVFAMGTLMSTWPFGIALALVTQPPLAAAFGWRAGLIVTALACMLSLVLVLALYRSPPGAPAPGVGSTWWNPPDRATIRSVLLAGLLWSSFNLGLVLMLGFSVVLLERRGLPALEAAALTSLPLWIAILSIPVGGFLVQRSGWPRSIAAISYLVAALALVLLALDVSPLLACIVFGLAVGPGPGVIMALPARVLQAEHRITGFGLFNTVFGITVGLGPWLAGLLADRAGTPAAALLLGAALFVLCVPLAMLFEATAPRTSSR